MDTALPQNFPFNLDRNLAKANWIGNRVCTPCDIVFLAPPPYLKYNRQRMTVIAQTKDYYI